MEAVHLDAARGTLVSELSYGQQRSSKLPKTPFPALAGRARGCVLFDEHGRRPLARPSGAKLIEILTQLADQWAT
jgi:hypothetical protein